jgi:hypothetical protein
MSRGKYHQGEHTFNWPASMEIRFNKFVGGERKRFNASGSMTFKFGDEHKDLVPFAVSGLELRVPEFDVFFGAFAFKDHVRLPAFTVDHKYMKRSQGWLQPSTGRWWMDLELEITSKSVPILDEVKRLGILHGFDPSTISAKLTEYGTINGHSGAFRAHGILLIGDAKTTGPANAFAVAGSLQCDASGSIGVGIGTQANADFIHQDLAVVCVGTKVTFVYSCNSATKKATLTGPSLGTTNLALPQGSVTIPIQNPGPNTYTFDVSTGSCDNSTTVQVIGVTNDTPFSMVAVLQSQDFPWPYQANLSQAIFDPKISVVNIEIDPNYNPPVKDALGNPVIAWNGSLFNPNGLGHSFTAGFAIPPSPQFSAHTMPAGQWTFIPANNILDNPQTQQGFLLVLQC